MMFWQKNLFQFKEGLMLKEHLFVNILMLLQLGAIFSYLITKNWALATYWTACLTINFLVTYVALK